MEHLVYLTWSPGLSFHCYCLYCKRSKNPVCLLVFRHTSLEIHWLRFAESVVKLCKGLSVQLVVVTIARAKTSLEEEISCWCTQPETAFTKTSLSVNCSDCVIAAASGKSAQFTGRAERLTW